jgi:hypothetical protein
MLIYQTIREYLETHMSEAVITNPSKNSVIFQWFGWYTSSLVASLMNLLTNHFYMLKQLSVIPKLNRTSDNPVHLSLWNMKSSLLTRLATLLTNSFYMTKAIRCHKRQPPSYTPNQ